MQELQNLIKQQRQQLREKDELLEKYKSGQIPSHLNKDDVKKAMQNIITMEVEQRTKAWISQQPAQQPTATNQVSISTLDNHNKTLKTQVSQLRSEREELVQW
mmetsp:Transcript_24289/g.32546  ORF Transcript_24289/g.32546 Transcript_24289/m.32546 type:complete len:103 (+) Transcript_24289:1398-1706(+)